MHSYDNSTSVYCSGYTYYGVLSKKIMLFLKHYYVNLHTCSLHHVVDFINVINVMVY